MREQLVTAVASACKALYNHDVDVQLTRPEEQFGDFATNVALQLSKPVGKNPREIADALVEKLKTDLAGQLKDVSVAGPGFINFSLTDRALDVLSKETPTQSMAGKSVVAEYSDPNPFKDLHAGHLYTTLVGDGVASLLEHAGANVHRVNFGGDVGLHVGRCMWGILQTLGGEYPERLTSVRENERLKWLSNRYVVGNKAYTEDEVAKAEIIDLNKRVYQLHTDNDHESPFAQIYWTCRQWSYDGFDALYEQLQVHPFEKYYPESVTTPHGVAVVEKGLKEGVFKESDGAVVFKGDDMGLHTRVFINSAGLPTYETKDLGRAVLQWDEYHFDLNVIITGNDIVEYMKVVMAALTPFHPEVAARTKHMTHGMIKLPGGVKMSSRLGNTLTANDVMEAARAAQRETTSGENEDTVLAAVKYAFMKQRIGGDIIYDPAESVALEGNSGPYIQYAHARARSILAKAPDFSGINLEVLEAGERSLLRKISEYTEVVDTAISELMPHHICTYLYELAQVFNRFYEHNRVMGDEREATRLELVQRYADTLKNGLDLLNIPAPERL